MELDPATKRQGVCATLILWDMSRCPLPADVDARRVGPFIRKNLKKLGYIGPLTITAIGILSEVSHDVLRDLSSTGINLDHVPTTDVSAVMSCVISWQWRNKPPANIMLISLQKKFCDFLDSFSLMYTILGPIYPYDPQNPPSTFRRFGGCFRWESLLSSLRASVSSEEDEEYTGTGESNLYCSACLLGLLGFENFTMHLDTKQHALEELEFYRTEGISAARECRSLSKDATAIRLVLSSFRKRRRLEQKKEDEEEEELKKKKKMVYYF